MHAFARITGSLALALPLAACAPMSLENPFGFLKGSDHGLQTMSQKLGPDGPTLSFDFEFDDQADASDGEVGSGYIVVSQDGKELQALPHAFEIPHERLEAQQWLSFRDFNGDGLLDFKVTRLYMMDGQLPLETLYQFDPKTGRFAQVDAVSNAGEIQATTANCLSLKVVGASGLPKLENHCYAAATGRWQLAKPEVVARGKRAASDSVEPVCDAVSPELVACRKARIEQDKALLSMVRDYRTARMQTLMFEQGRDYARAYAKTQDLDHRSWRQYRDARCAAQSRERAVPTAALPATIERCRFEWSRDQLRRYKEQIAHLSESKPAKVVR